MPREPIEPHKATSAISAAPKSGKFGKAVDVGKSLASDRRSTEEKS